MNRFALINKSLDRTTLTFGRQRIAHDDQRFVGNVGWHQHEQTLDGLRAQWATPKIKSGSDLCGTGESRLRSRLAARQVGGRRLLANFAYTLPVGTLSVFDYYLDIDNATTASSNTVGTNWSARSRSAN